MGVLLACLMIHAVLATAIASPWWCPDLRLVGLVLAIGRAPARWLAYSVTVGLVTMPWLIRHSWAMWGGFLAIGWGLRALADQWETSSIGWQAVTAGLAALSLALYWLWLDGSWSMSLVGWAGWRGLLTALSVPAAWSLLGWGPRRTAGVLPPRLRRWPLQRRQAWW